MLTQSLSSRFSFLVKWIMDSPVVPLSKEVRNASLFAAARRVLLLGGIALCLSLLCTSKARAACGYNVVAGNPSATLMAGADRMQHPAAPSDRPGCPCHGPGCRAGDPSPATTSTPPTNSDQQGACLCDPVVSLDALLVSDLSSVKSSLFSDVYLPVFYPPPRLL